MPVHVTVATPGADEELCGACKGKGATSKYDEGWRSLVHDPELAALRDCMVCGGRGVVPKREDD